jgi:isopenicillin N synthase-like dioxygenase
MMAETVAEAQSNSALAVGSILAAYPDSIWDQAVRDWQENSGVAIVDLNDESLQSISAIAFDTAETAFDRVTTDPDVVTHIPDAADSGHVTGYHPAAASNSLSRYNAHRRGFVWSDDGVISVAGMPEFANAQASLQDVMHLISDRMLTALERQLQIPGGWFQGNMGPMRSSSQWHVKQYVVGIQQGKESDSSDAKTPVSDLVTSSSAQYLLPIHTDPSLISILIHRRPGKQQKCQGLEYHRLGPDGSRVWTPVPSSGHGVAVILVGSVLSHMTAGYFAAAKHRVVQSQETKKRMAATLFVRPVPTAVLQVPPSPLLQTVSLKRNVTFDMWNSRVARNYSKKKTSTVTDAKQAGSKQQKPTNGNLS